MEFAKQSKFKCPANRCGRDAKFVRATVEEFIHSVGGEKPSLYIVECAKHGQKLITMDLQPVTQQNRSQPTARTPAVLYCHFAGLITRTGTGFRSLAAKNSFSFSTRGVSLAGSFSSITARQSRSNACCSSGVIWSTFGRGGHISELKLTGAAKSRNGQSVPGGRRQEPIHRCGDPSIQCWGNRALTPQSRTALS